MLILISSFLLFAAALSLGVIRMVQPSARYTWLVAVGGAALAFLSVFAWQLQMPFELALPAWQPIPLLTLPILFSADGFSWALALSVATLTFSALLTAAAQPVHTMSFSWVGTLALGGLGILAVTADNPLTLLLVWAALDLTELITQLGSVNGPENNEKVAVSFSTRALGIGALLWAGIVSAAKGRAFDFALMDAGVGVYLVLAAGLRLGVFPLHLPYSSESPLRRGLGTPLRMVSAASSLILLGRAPAGGLTSILAPFLLAFALIPAIYGGWMWLRAPDELNGRPYWIIGAASLSVIAALGGNPSGAVAWGAALILSGSALFLASAQHVWLNRITLLAVFSLSSLPFSLTAAAWIGNFWLFLPFGIAAQALMLAGFVRHVRRSTGREPLDAQPGWARAAYAGGILLLVGIQLMLGFFGWDGAWQIGAWWGAVAASLLTLGLVWATPRFRIFNPPRAHWLKAMPPFPSAFGQAGWSLYRSLARISEEVNRALEGEGGVLWTLLFLILFISILARGAS